MRQKAIKELRNRLDALRILNTSFPVYSPTGVWIEKQTHFLLTYTPKERPMAEEEFQLNERQIQELFTLVYDVLEIAEDKSKASKVKSKERKELK